MRGGGQICSRHVEQSEIIRGWNGLEEGHGKGKTKVGTNRQEGTCQDQETKG